MMVSMNSPNSSIRVRGGRTRHKTTSTKRSGSGDERKYIEHLEGELSAVQSELPSVTQEHALKMNRINAENRQLQAQLKEWELRYEEEVRDAVQQHDVAERQLRHKNSNLEDYASRAKDRVVELESQVQRMQQALEGAEAANLQLERRITMLSELLTPSPAKTDLSTDAPTRRRMRPRPQSMLPRVPSHRGSWIGSPERTPDFGALVTPGLPHDNASDVFEPLQRIVSREPWSSPQSSERDDYSASVRGGPFADMAPPPEPRSRPTRRMRRFGGGSNGPKPLILPYTSQVDPISVTAPPLDNHERTPSLPFQQGDGFDSPLPSRSRARTSASENALGLIDSPEASERYDEAGFQRILSLAQSSGTREFSFVSTSERAGLASRNLLDELHAAKVDEPQAASGADDDLEPLSRITTLDNDDKLFMIPVPILPLPLSRQIQPTAWETESVELSPLTTRRDPFNPALESIMGPLRSTSPDLDATPKAISKLSPASEEDLASLSALDRLKKTFGDLLYSPGDVARMVIHAVQQKIHIPAPLLSVQWWMVGMLWGPMAKRHMIQHSSDESRYRESFRSQSPSLALDESLAYGTVYTSPVSGLRRRAGMAGPGKKRSGNGQQCTKEKSLLARHNPILWIKFSITLAYAVGVAFTSGPGSLLPGKQCTCSSCKHAE